jgi:hypothetical protein
MEIHERTVGEISVLDLKGRLVHGESDQGLDNTSITAVM